MTEQLFTAKQLQAAFEEGFERGDSHGNLQWKYPQVGIAWMVSDARKLLGRSEDRSSYAHWKSMKCDEAERYDISMEVLE